MADQRPVVLCLGDSHTEGVYGGNWMASLAKEFPQLRFVNRGGRAEPSWAGLGGLGRLLAAGILTQAQLTRW